MRKIRSPFSPDEESMRYWTALLFLFLASGFLGAQDPWGPLVGPIRPGAEPLGMDFNALAALDFPPDSPYLLGLEVEIQVPRELIPLRGSCVVLLYQGERQSSGQGLRNSRRLASEVLPPVNRYFLQLPLSPASGLKAGIDKMVLAPPLQRKGGEVFLTILPIDKGFTSESGEISGFQVRTRPLLKNLGGVAFNFRGLNPSLVSQIQIKNGQTRLDPKAVNFLPPGLYNLEVSGSAFRTQTLKVAVAQGLTETLDVMMVESKALLRLEVPAGTRITIDGQEVADPSAVQSVELGDRTLQLLLGDYTLTKVLNLTRPGTYRVSLLMEIHLVEEN